MSWRSTMMFAVCCPIVIASVLLWLKASEQKATRCLAVFFFFGVMAIMPQIIGFAGFYDVWPGFILGQLAFANLIEPLITRYVFTN